MVEDRWERVTSPAAAGFLAGLGVFVVVVLLSPAGFIPILDHANLLFHEAGHVGVGLVSQRLEPYGGTLGQLVFPGVLAVSFWRKGQPLSFATAVAWFFQNGLNIAHYMADARALQLPLVGGGEHDWNTILSRWGLLNQDTHLAAGVRVVAWLGILAAGAWVGWMAWKDREKPTEI